MAEIEQLSIRGWEIIRLSTEAIQVDLVPALGGTITSLLRRADGAELLWTAPWGLRHLGSPSLPGNSQALMYDTFPGGWFSMFPNAGDSAVQHGAEWGEHGEARLTWMDWSSTGSSLQLQGRLIRSPFQFAKTVSVHGHQVTIDETATNVADERIETVWASQLMLGGALIGPDTIVDAGASTVHPDPIISRGTDYHDIMPWPRSYATDSVVNLRTLPAPGAGETRLAYLTDFSRPSVSITRPAHDLGLDLSWDLDCWPYAWYAMEAGGSTGFPWFSNSYHLALTPASSWPGQGVHAARRVSDTALWFGPGQARTSSVTATVRPRS